jgi:hypothetical protein
MTIIVSKKPFGKRPFEPFEAKRFAELLDQELGAGFAASHPAYVMAYTQRKVRDTDESIAEGVRIMVEAGRRTRRAAS